MAHVSTVTIAASQVPADQTSFPVLLPTPPTDSGIWTTATSSGGDIRIFASNGTTELAREIVSFDATAKTCEIWVKVPFLSSSSDTEIQIHADGASSDYAVTAAYGRNTVWADYKGVWHGGRLADSTGSGRTLSVSGATVATGAGVTSGQDAYSFDGVDDHLSAASSPISTTPANGLSIQAWAKAVTTTGVVFGAFRALPASEWTAWYISANAGGNWQAVSTLNNSFSGISVAGAVTAGSWKLVSGVFSSTGATTGYLNSSAGTTDPSGALPTAVNSIRVGESFRGDNNFEGLISEIRIREGALSANWITTEYNNQSDPNTFATWADEAAVAVPVLGAITATATTANSISFSIPVTF